jgi:EAL domain-containing protein (putative c-di-GMP-specific phosphodiesterase class I)/GGDEF domain-containing protein
VIATAASTLEPNQFDAKIENVIAQIRQLTTDSKNFAVLLIHVHDFDRLCATLGHVRAEKTLTDFHARLDEFGHGGNHVFRLSDRKFAIVLCNVRNKGHVQLAAQKIQRQINIHSNAGLIGNWLRASVGVALGSADYDGANEVLRSAEIALLEGRRENQALTFYQNQTDNKLVAEWDLERKLADALEGGDLELYYQPKYCFSSDSISGAEALMRWHDRELGPVSPDKFIGVAEATGLITELTYFAIQRACRQLDQWQQSMGDFSVAINISPSIIRNLEIVDVLKSATSIWSVSAGALALEVTENALMADPKTSHGVLTGIREFGAKVSLDDFGTGYSSLAYLKKIPADELKIDRSFVMNMLADEGDFKIVKHAISIAKSFGLTVVAEGVESRETLEALRSLGCDFAQGYYISKPLPPDAFLAWYQERQGAGLFAD